MMKFYVLPPNMAELRKLSEHAHYLQRLNLAPTECTQSDPAMWCVCVSVCEVHLVLMVPTAT